MIKIKDKIRFEDDVLVFDKEHQYLSDGNCVLDALISLPDTADDKLERIMLDKPVRDKKLGYKSSPEVFIKDLNKFIDYNFIKQVEAEKVLELSENPFYKRADLRLFYDNDKAFFLNSKYFEAFEHHNCLEFFLHPDSALVYIFAKEFYESEMEYYENEDEKPVFIMALMICEIGDGADQYIAELKDIINIMKTKKIYSKDMGFSGDVIKAYEAKKKELEVD